MFSQALKGGPRNSSGTEGNRYETEKFLKKNDFAGTLNNIIQSKACQINLYNGPDSFRSAIAEERLKAGVGTGETLLQKQVQGEAPLTTSSIALWITPSCVSVILQPLDWVKA